MSEEALDLLTNTINIENKRLDLDKIFEHPFFKKGKGLSRDSFPEHNDKDYKIKIFKLSQELGIKPINRKAKSDIEKDINKKSTYKKKLEIISPHILLLSHLHLMKNHILILHLWMMVRRVQVKFLLKIM
jgi:hypothetical protein